MPKVLVVEDDLRVVAMIRQHLQLEGFSVVEASDAKEAWQLLLEERPDAALIDLNLRTERDGWGLVGTVREDGRFARLPTVVMTGVEEPHLTDRADELGSGFLSKPFSGAEVVEGLRQAMKRALNTSRVVLHLAALRIEGTVHLPAGRFSDGWEALMREERVFVPVTEATVSAGDSSDVEVPFLEVRKADILAVHPLESG
jgi:DNA-binding response OmpR family regulator